MGGASSFLAMLSIALFLFCGWLATKVSKAAGVSSIVLEITVGVILGPAVLGVVAPAYAECQYRRHVDCTPPADFERLILEGKPLGGDLDKIAGSLCHKEDYHLVEHDVVNGAATHGVELGADSSSTEDGRIDEADATGFADEDEITDIEKAAAAAVEAHPVAADDHAAADTHGADMHPVDPNAGDEEVAVTPAAAGLHRRLSGGGTYHSYSECLLKTCAAEVAHDCQLTPDFFTLIGHTGVALMIFESGMHFDFEKARVVGPKACAVAVLGTILPLITGALLTVIYGRPLFPDGVSVGTALAPTSVGIALRLLGEANVLQEDFGQAIITAAFVDDILSLILFNVLFSLRGDFQFVPVVVFPILGIIFMVLAMLAAVKFWPKFINETIMPRIPTNEGAKVSPHDEALFLIMMTVLVAYATLTYFLGTHLWGCFIAGMSFACIDRHHWPHHVWVKQTKRATSWMIRIFFSATVAFSIPIGQLLSIEAFLKGSLMGIGPCILTKVLCAPFMGDAKFVIGWAMVGRAEFAYLIAQMAASADMMDQSTFSIVIWALLYATVFAPFIFRKVLARYVAKHFKNEEGEYTEDGPKEAAH